MSDGKISGTQWKALTAAWLGWCFDGLDGFLYVLVALPFVTELLHKTAVDSDVQRKAAIIQAFFLVGWAVGGAVFGRIGDRLGRARTLTLTVLTYAIFTGLAFFATEWWHLLIFRFIAALGIGGEWAAGSALVAETLHPRHRAWASATLQSGYMVGCIAAAVTIRALSGFPERYVFLVGVLPAILTIWIRWAVPEPEEWRRQSRAAPPPPVSAIFSRQWRRTTILTLLLTSISLTTVWAFLFFSSQILRSMPEVSTWTDPQVKSLVFRVTITYLLVNIAANYFATYLARFAGYRFAFAFMLTGGLAVFTWGYWNPPTLDNVNLIFSLTAFFALGLFGLFPLYIPPLFPTMLRTMGAGVCYNTGRLVSAVGTMFGGAIAAEYGPSAAIWWTGMLFIPGILVALLISEGPHSRNAKDPVVTV
ncbi:MAG: MFS transporter [Phycisphaeraceae bacterium]|nr:MFS transporter [Phycisphaeraceae bacterium]